MLRQNWIKYIAFIILGMVIVILSVIFLFQLIDVPVYPNLTGHYSTDFGIRWDDCGNVTKAGFTIHKEGSYYSDDQIEDIRQWYKQFEWDDFVIKGADLGIIKISKPTSIGLKISPWKRAQYSEIPGAVNILTDSYISFCWNS